MTLHCQLSRLLDSILPRFPLFKKHPFHTRAVTSAAVLFLLDGLSWSSGWILVLFNLEIRQHLSEKSWYYVFALTNFLPSWLHIFSASIIMLTISISYNPYARDVQIITNMLHSPLNPRLRCPTVDDSSLCAKEKTQFPLFIYLTLPLSGLNPYSHIC